jgi:diguanylate cyclase (GGDEF)-like protein/PAS domain S-box-containing protein
MKPPSHSFGHLTQAEHWFRILAETSPAAIFVFRDRILYANPAASELTGYSESELLQLSFDQLLESKIEDPEDKIERTIRLVRKDGEIRSARSTSAYVELDWQPATMLSAIDVTAQLEAQAKLEEVSERLRLAQRVARWVTWEWVPDTDRLDTSPFADTLFGMNIQDDVQTGGAYLSLVHPEDRDRLRRATEHLLKGGEDLAIEVRCLTPRSEIRWLSMSGVAIRNADDRVERVLGVTQDVTDQKITENKLFPEKDRAFVTLSAIADGVIRTDARGAIDYLNPVAQRLTGWSLSESYGRPATEIYQVVDEETGKDVLDPVEHCLNEQREVIFLGQRLLIRRDGSRFPIHDSAAPILDRHGRLTGAILVFRDLTQMRQVEEEMQHLASHDPLTGLVNRREFRRLIREIFLTKRGEVPRHALCHLDLDAFKLINDTCGHAAGDQLLRHLTGLLAQQIQHHDLLARVGGDEFGILFRDCSADEARQRAQDICDAIHDFRFHWDGRKFSPRVSIGLVPLTSQTSGPETLLGAADAACFVAKEAGGGRIHVFEPGDEAIAERYGEMQWISRIQHGMDEDRFCLWHQGIHPVRDDMPVPPLAELFIRLIDDEGNIVSPGTFIPAAERYGLIDTIDRWVVRAALKSMSNGGQSLVGAGARFAINISGQSLGADGFLDYIIREIETTGIAPNRVLFEITETSAIANLRKAMRFISVLKEMGCLFVLDDFGQGLSSFSYLKSLPLDFIKIDGAFVREMVQDPIQAALVASIKDIGEVMGLQTIAESVEDAATFEALTRIGVDYVQGYYLDRPQPLTTSTPPPVGSKNA